MVYLKIKGSVNFLLRKEVSIIFLYDRAAQILLYLLNSNVPRTISQIQKLLMVSNRTVRYDLDNIDNFLVANGMNKLQRKPRVGVSFMGEAEDRKKLKEVLVGAEKYDFVFSPDERIIMIILAFIDADDYITTEELSQKLGVSQSTINNDLKKARRALEEYGLNIVFRQRHGLKLVGEERHIRKLLVELWTEYVYDYSDIKSKSHKHGKSNSFGIRKYMDRLIDDIDIPFIENIVNIMEKKIGVDYSDVAYANIVAHICVSLMRINKGRYIDLNLEDKNMVQTREYTVAKDLIEIVEGYYNIKIIEDEIIYITACLLGGNLSSIYENSKGEWIHIQLLVKEVIELVNSKIISDIGQDWKLYNSLLEHIKPMINRLKYGIKLENPILKSIKEDYEELFQIVKESVYPIEEFIGKKINDDEIGYLTIHFGAAIERERFSGIVLPRVVIVCNTGIGTSELLSVQIQSMFEVSIVAVVSKRKLEEILDREDIDVIISTVPIENVKGIKVIYVSPILSEDNIKELNGIFLKSSGKRVEIDGLISVIERSCTINDRHQLEKDLYNIFNLKMLKNEDGDDKPVLKDIISKETIKLNVEAKNWEEAVRIGGELLVKVGAAEERYVDSMIEAVKEIGPYIVILEGVAMPHARPEEGALEIGMSIITLKEPIEFGNKENDPVKLVISFCAVDSESHLKALSQLMVLLEDEEAIDRIVNSIDVDEILEIIDKFSK